MKNEIHVWLAGLEEGEICLDACANCLSSAERERAARFKFAQDRKHYVVAHAALRSILGIYLGVNPAFIAFAAGPAGKPKLAPTLADSRLEFNLSHSGSVALVAVARGKEIGVDVERMRADFDFEPIAQRFFTAKEVEALRRLPGDLQTEAFYKCWTAKEALLKAKGTGLSGPLDEVHIEAVGTCIRITPAQRGWTLGEVSPIPDYAAVLALETRPHKIRCCRWDASTVAASGRS